MMVPSEAPHEVFATPYQPLHSGQRFFAVYFKPLLLATAATLLLSFLVAYGCMVFTARFSASNLKQTQRRPDLFVQQDAATGNKKPAGKVTASTDRAISLVLNRMVY